MRLAVTRPAVLDESTAEAGARRAVGAFAGGRVINAKTARSQLLGGIVRGFGSGLIEGVERDARTGRVVTRELTDYHVPVNVDEPPIDVVLVDEDNPHVSGIWGEGVRRARYRRRGCGHCERRIQRHGKTCSRFADHPRPALVRER